MPPTKADKILQENEFLYSQNSNYRSYCQDLADYFLPRKAWIDSIRVKGERVKFNFLYDSTAILAARTAAHGIQSNLTNETMRWFRLESIDHDDMKRRDNQLWFKEVEDKMFTVLRGSNFYNVQLEDYHGKLVFGTGTYSMLEDPRDIVKFKNIPVGQVHRVVDDVGNLREIFINFKLRASEAVRLFGNNVGPSVMKAVVKKPHDEFEFLHYVGERHDRDPRFKDKSNMPFKSCWIAKKDKHLIDESGFMEMPYISGIFYADSNDPNGFSPAMDVFPWVKLLNAMARTIIRAGMKQTDPPLVAPHKGFVLPLNFNPAGMNYRDAKTPNDAITALPSSNGRVDLGIDLLKMVQENVRHGMFVPLFQTMNDITKQLTVLEAQQLVTQNMSILGPVVGRFDHDTLSPMIFRLYSILNRNLELPPPPASLQNGKFRVVYLGPLAKAQKQSEVAEMQSWMADVNAIGSIIPRAYDNVDEDKLIQNLHRTRGLTPEVIRDDEVVARMRKHREEQEQMIAALQAGQAGADIAKTAAEAESKGSQ